MPPRIDPPAVLADALQNFYRDANLALAAVENHARKQVDQAIATAEEVRRERDEAIQELHATQLREKDWEANIKSAELRIEHQAEEIVRLKEEADRWRNQLLRFEETSRQEIQSWKEQYMHAEQEKNRSLSAQIKEFISEQLSNQAHTLADPSSSAPRLSRQPIEDSRKSQVRNTKTTTNGVTLPDGLPFSQPRTPGSNAVASSSRAPKQRHATEPSTSTIATYAQQSVTPARPSVVSSRVIRRVHAVVEVPVKEEDDDNNGAAYLSQAESVRSVRSAAANATNASNATPARKKSAPARNGGNTPKAGRKSASNGKVKQTAPYVEIDEDEDTDASEEDEDEEDGSEYQPKEPPRARPGRNLIRDDDDDDDPMLLGSEASNMETPQKSPKKRRLSEAGAASSRGTAKARKKN